jgi:hypothetical protein
LSAWPSPTDSEVKRKVSAAWVPLTPFVNPFMLEVVDSCVRVLRVALGGGNSRWSVEVVEEWQSRASVVNNLN